MKHPFTLEDLKASSLPYYHVGDVLDGMIQAMWDHILSRSGQVVTDDELDELEERIWQAWKNHDLGGDEASWMEFIAKARASKRLAKQNVVLEDRLEGLELRLAKAEANLVAKLNQARAGKAALEKELKHVKRRLWETCGE